MTPERPLTYPPNREPLRRDTPRTVSAEMSGLPLPQWLPVEVELARAFRHVDTRPE